MLDRSPATPTIADAERETLRAEMARLRASNRHARAVISALQDAQYLSQSVLESVDEGVIVYDRDLRYRLWNPFMERLSGLRASHVIGKHALDVFPHLRQQGVSEMLTRALAGEVVRSPDVHYHVPQTDRRGWYAGLYSPHRSSAGEIVGVIATIHDTTDRKKAETILAESEAKYRSLIEHSNDIIYLIYENRFEIVNKKFEEVIGLAASTVCAPGFDPMWLVAPRSVDMILERRRLRDAGIAPASRFELVIRDTNGVEFEMETSIVDIPFRGGIATQGIMRDMTHRKKLEAQSNLLEIEQERRRITSEFIRDASHEFRTPLSIINSSLYLMDKTMDSRQADYRRRQIADEVEIITKLLDDLLTLSRLDGNLTLCLRQVDLGSLIRQTLTAWPAGRVTVGVESVESPFIVLADAALLREALRRLIENAIKFTPEDGRIVIRLGAAESTAVVILEDSGPGIDSSEFERVFERFYRGDRAHSTRGFGLGLPIARKILEAHGGTIWAGSVAEQGAAFTVSIPFDGSVA